MKLSFVIPAYNEEDLLGKCIESIQKEANGKACEYEIIVVNNASTDSTAEVALSYPGVVLVHEPRKGLSQARHSGFKAASGELIANVDADTMLTEGWIETVLEQFGKKPKLVALSGPQVFYDLGKGHNYAIRAYYYLGYAGYLSNKFVLRVGSLIQGGNFVVKKSALEQIGGYNPEFVFYGEDADIARRLHKVGDVVFTFKLPIYASGRRIANEGKIKMAARYSANYLWTTFLGKPFTKSFVDIRVPAKNSSRPGRS